MAKEDQTGLLFLGSGSSTGVPRVACVVAQEGVAAEDATCPVCFKAAQGDPCLNKHYRGNPSLVVRYARRETAEEDGGSGSDTACLLIDCCKTFRECAVRWLRTQGIRRLDSVLLTHDHADAVLGLDDLRGLEPKNQFHDKKPRKPVAVYASPRTYASMQRVFPYLTRELPTVKGVKRHVAALDWHVMEVNENADAYAEQGDPETEAGTEDMAEVVAAQTISLEGGFPVTLLPVMHGEDYVSLGFAFAGPGGLVVYISDVSRIPSETMRVIQWLAQEHGTCGRIDVLILDALFLDHEHPTHFNFYQSCDMVKFLAPHRAHFVGLSDEIDADVLNAELAADATMLDLGISASLAHDGLFVPLSL